MKNKDLTNWITSCDHNSDYIHDEVLRAEDEEAYEKALLLEEEGTEKFFVEFYKTLEEVRESGNALERIAIKMVIEERDLIESMYNER